MKTTLGRRTEKQGPPFGRDDNECFPETVRDSSLESAQHSLRQVPLQGRDTRIRSDVRARVCATAGAVVWAGIAVLARAGVARIGAVELMFLFAPLVIVPLGMELGRLVGGGDRLQEIARRLQPLGAGLAVYAVLFSPGRSAGWLAIGWLGVCVLMAGDGVLDCCRALWGYSGKGERSAFVGATLAIARIDLAVGGAWFVASRMGMRPMGIQEPIGMLTAVHFHFAGFATATIAAATLQFAERRWLKPVVAMVLGMPFVVAAGFVISPGLKMGAAFLFSASVAGLAIFMRACGRRAKDATARVLLQVAAGAVFAGMILSGTYAVADFFGSDVLTIPQMARTHGILNAVGFCLLGLLGWVVEKSRTTLTMKDAKVS
jgi:hypothetical protein